MDNSTEEVVETMHIGELADRTGLSLRTIRHYDQVGLLPAMARTDGGFRVYTSKDVERLLVIRQMKPLGFSLEEMGDLLTIIESRGPVDGEARQRLDRYSEMASQQRERIAGNLRRADEFIAELKEQ